MSLVSKSLKHACAHFCKEINVAVIESTILDALFVDIWQVGRYDVRLRKEAVEENVFEFVTALLGGDSTMLRSHVRPLGLLNFRECVF